MAIAALSVAGFVLLRPIVAPPISAPATATIKPTPRETPQTLAQVAPKLGDASQPFRLAVIGDSTGFGPLAWVRQTVEQIVSQTGRAALIHEWNPKTNSYDPPNRMGPAGKESLIVWNGSAPGQSAQYANDNFATMLPEKADLIIVNHGHNISSPEAADKQFRQLMLGIRSSKNEFSAVAITLQNPQIDKDKDRADAVRAVIGDYAKTIPDVTLIDAYSAFTNAGNVPALLNPDGLHPVRAGYTIWANTVLPMLWLKPSAS